MPANKVLFVVGIASLAIANASNMVGTEPHKPLRFLGEIATSSRSKPAPSTAPNVKNFTSVPEEPLLNGKSPGVNVDMTAASMEAAITDLMLGKSAFGATPMGGSVMKIKNIIVQTMLPKVFAAHKSDQRELNRLAHEIGKCGSVKKSQLRGAQHQFTKYRKQSSLHKRCRKDEAVRSTSYTSCLARQRSLFAEKKMKCSRFASLSNQLGTTKNNIAIAKKAGSETVQSYVTRLSTTFCGRHVHGPRGRRPSSGGWGGGLVNGILDRYLKSKHACQSAAHAYAVKVRDCQRKRRSYFTKKAQCNQHQTLMDGASCKRAILTKDACESYAACFFSKKQAYNTVDRKVRHEMVYDRKAEWRGLKRMECLINSFADGKVTNKEVDLCKKGSHKTKHLNIKYPKIPSLVKCAVSQLYPSTGAYRRAEFAKLPALALGKVSAECAGLQEISLRPARGSPKACKCTRVTLNGAYSAGAMVKCTNCKDTRRSRDKNSCPRGTKVFSPASRNDWKTFINSAKPLRAPHWIVDVTRPLNHCGGCTSSPMNSGNNRQTTWRTSDGSPWWLRSTRYNEPNGDYTANCYLDLWRTPKNEKDVRFNDWNCHYHSKSYYCQAIREHLKPTHGSPASCKCVRVQLSGRYSAGSLVKCEQCISVSRASQKNSCPVGMKIFSPRSRADWKTFLASAKPLRAPHWIIDVTRPQNGCGGCTRHAMKSTTPQQASWRASDGSAWWLRGSRYNEPNGDYSANCFLDLWKTPNSENNVQFNDWRCRYHSRSYYCQPQKAKPKPKPKVKSCARPGGWCGHKGSSYTDKMDCDGDGIPDPYCYDITGHTGFIGSATKCSSGWPRTRCKAAMCRRPRGWCTHKGATFTTLHDCDGDGVKDLYCIDQKGGHYGFISSKHSCKSSWPKQKCLGASASSISALRVGTVVALWSNTHSRYVKMGGGSYLSKSPAAPDGYTSIGCWKNCPRVWSKSGAKGYIGKAACERLARKSNARFYSIEHKRHCWIHTESTRILKIPDRGTCAAGGASCLTHVYERGPKLPQGWGAEKFTVVDAGDGKIAFWNAYHKQMVKLGHLRFLMKSPRVNQPKLPRGWGAELFNVVDAGNGEVGFWNPHYKRFMRMPTGNNMDKSGVARHGNLPHNWAWERFKVVPVH